MVRFSNLPKRETNAIAVYWDALVRQYPAVPVPPADLSPGQGTMIRQLHAEELVGSLPPYQDQLLQQLLATYEETPSMNATTATAPALSPPRAPARPALPKHPAAWVRRNAMPALEIALIILLILASIASIWLTTSRNDEPRVIVPPVATPTEATSDVPMYRGNAERTGAFPGPGLDGQPVEIWRAEVDGEIRTAPAVVDGVLYFGAGDGGIHALDLATGTQLWSFAGSSPIQSSPAVANGIIFAGSENGTLYAVNAADGSEVWTFPGARADVAPVVVGDVLYTGSDDGFLYALNATTGEELWGAPLDDAASRSPAVAAGVVYIGSADGVLHTFDAITGEPGWTARLEGGSLATTAIADGVVYQNTFLGEINHAYALDAATGDELWRFTTGSGEGFYPPAVGNGLVYLPSDDFSVYAVNAETGAEVWRFATGDHVVAAPALAGDTLYVGGRDNILYALDAATGTEHWRLALEGQIEFGPTVTGGVAFVGTTFGIMYAIGGTGETLATPSTAGPGAATPAATPAPPVATPETSTGLARFVWEAGQGGEEPPQQPVDVAVAPDGTIWVTDSDSGELHQFSPDGMHLASHAMTDLIAGGVDAMVAGSIGGALAFDGQGNLFVIDPGNHRVLKFGPDLEYMLAWGSQGNGAGQFQAVSDVEIDSEGNVYVLDWSRADVQKFSPDGTHLATIGTPGTGEGQLAGPARFGIGPDDVLYVPDGSQVEVFASDGTFLRSLGDFGYAVDATVDTAGNVFVSDGERSTIHVYDPAGTLVGSWGAFGREPGDFIQVDALALDSLGGVYVVDFGNGRIQKFAVTLPVMPDATPVATPVS